MYVLSRFFRGYGGRLIVGSLIALSIVFSSVGTLLAGTTGTINGTVTDASSKPINGVKVTAVSLTARYTGATNQQGFYSFTGVQPDTYTVSFEATGFQPVAVTGVNVFADQIAVVNSPAGGLSKSLITIAKLTTRAAGGAYQPSQTTDTYSYTAGQIANELGKTFAPSESNLIATLPGASFDSSGYPVIRGGRENEESFQYEGIPYTDAFTNQFVNTLALNSGVAGFQLTPGAGDASLQSAGTGTLNLISKRGTRPAFGTLDFEALTWPFNHQFGFEYGWATPDGRISNYTSLLAQNRDSVYQARNADTSRIGAAGSRAFQTGRTFTNNFVYKFGRDLSQSLQVFYDNDQFNFYNMVGGYNYCYPTCNPVALTNITAFMGLANSAANQAFVAQRTAFYPGQTAANQNLIAPNHSSQPNDTFKVQYSNNLDSSTYMTMKYFAVNAGLISDNLWVFQSYPDEQFVQGGRQSGVTLDITKQLNAKNLLKVGAQYMYLQPIDTVYSGVFGLLAATGFGNSGVGYDFFNVNPFTGGAGYYAPGQPGFNQIPGGAANFRFPPFLQNPTMPRQDWGFYLNNTFSPTDRIKIDTGVRIDGSNFRYPSEAPCNQYTAASIAAGIANVGVPWTVDAMTGANQCLFAANARDGQGNPIVTIDPQARKPVVVQPRAGVSWQFTRNDAFRASFGRTVEFPPIADIDARVGRGYYLSALGGVAPDPNAVFASGIYNGMPISCGVAANTPCSSLGEQLYWDNQVGVNGVPITPAKPETFTNWDASYSHQFGGGIGLKLTPFYRRGYDALSLVASPKLDRSGNPVINPVTGAVIFNPSVTTNLGIERTTGVEMLITRDLTYGLSGALSMTYINELSNVIPLSSSEDFFPTIPLASLQLGNVYRVGFLSPFTTVLALQYKTHGGLRINPVISYNRGYPFGNGLISGIFVNNVATNVPSTNTTAVGGNTTTPSGSTGAMQYVDPLNPGSVRNPNIAATRGGALSASAGGVLTAPRFNTNLDIELNPPGTRSTFGVFVSNLFGNVYGQPSVNGRWQPVATGIGGPKTGTTTSVTNFPGYAFVNYAPDRFGYQPFIISPNGTPTTFQLYYQLAL